MLRRKSLCMIAVVKMFFPRKPVGTCSHRIYLSLASIYSQEWQISRDNSVHLRKLEAVQKYITTVMACPRSLSYARNSELLLAQQKALRPDRTECKRSEDCKLFAGTNINQFFLAGKSCSR